MNGPTSTFSANLALGSMIARESIKMYFPFGTHYFGLAGYLSIYPSFTFKSPDSIVKPLVVATILASSAYAQEASQLSLGQPLLPKANIGEPYIRAENGDWAVRCVVTATGNDPCNMTN